MSKNIKILFLLAFISKLIISLFIPLTLDEYYYLVWGQTPQLSYFDHPPMTGWLMIFGNYFKSISPEAIRWPFILLSHGTLYVWYLILKPYLSPKYLFYFILVALFNPLWGLGVFVATPDIPLLFFWSCSIYFTYKLYQKPSSINYIALGAALGLGFLSKYQIVLFVPCLILFILNTKSFKHLLNIKVVLSILAGLLFSLPVLLWNYQHDWASFDFQWNHGMKATEWKWFWPLEYVLGQFLIIFPIFAILAFKNSPAKHPLSSLHNFIIFPLLFFLYSSFKNHVEANWAIMAYPSLYALAFINSNEKSLSWIKKSLIFWVTLLSAILIFITFPNQKIKSSRLFESNKFKNVLTFSKNHTPVLAFSYQLTSYLRFNVDENICKFPKYGRTDFYNFLKTCETIPQHFYFLLPTGTVYPLEKDFPELEIIKTIKIDDAFFALEVKRK